MHPRKPEPPAIAEYCRRTTDPPTPSRLARQEHGVAVGKETVALGDRGHHVVADHDALVAMSRQNQHSWLLSVLSELP